MNRPCLFPFFPFSLGFSFSEVKNSNPKEKVGSWSACCHLQLNFLLKFFPVFECKMPKSLTEKFLLSRHLFADVISVHKGNMKHARAIEFDYTNLPAIF